jgi:methyl-accepting chemotaxis protein
MKRVILFLNLFLILFLATLHYFQIQTNSARALSIYRNKMKTVVQIPYSLAEDFEKNFRDNPKLKQNQIQEEFINLSKELRYDKNDYFFIVDGKGNIINNPLRPGLSWWNMNNETDAEGNYLFRELISRAKRDGEVFIETNWQSKYNDQIFVDQIIFGKYFWPWDWIICTTLYKNEVLFEENPINPRFLVFTLIFYLIFNLIFILLMRRFNADNKKNTSKTD